MSRVHRSESGCRIARTRVLLLLPVKTVISRLDATFPLVSTSYGQAAACDSGCITAQMNPTSSRAQATVALFRGFFSLRRR